LTQSLSTRITYHRRSEHLDQYAAIVIAATQDVIDIKK